MAKKKKSEHSLQELEVLIEQEESKEKIISLLSELGKRCINNEHYFKFFELHVINEKDEDIKIILLRIIIDKFSPKKKKVQYLFDEHICKMSNLVFFKKILADFLNFEKDNETNNAYFKTLSSFVTHPILKVCCLYYPFLNDECYSLSDNLYYLRSKQKDIQLAEYLYFKGYFEGNTLISKITKKQLAKKMKDSKFELDFNNFKLPKKTLNFLILLLKPILDFKKDPIEYYILQEDIEPDCNHRDYIFDYNRNELMNHDPKWFAIVEKKKEICLLVKLEYTDTMSYKCDVCLRPFSLTFSKRFSHICFHCFIKQEKYLELTLSEATDLHYYGSYLRFIKIMLKAHKLKEETEQFNNLIKKGLTDKVIRKFYNMIKKRLYDLYHVKDEPKEEEKDKVEKLKENNEKRTTRDR